MTNPVVPYSADVLRIDGASEVERISASIRDVLGRALRRRGLVVAVSGGIDSSVVAALCVQAVGKDRVFGLLLPERDSSATTRTLSRRIVEHLGIPHAEEDITPILDAAGCYRRRDEAIRQVIPEYAASWSCKIVLPSVLEGERYSLFHVVAQAPGGGVPRKERLTPEAYLGVVAATNFKQRVRKMLEYYHADRLNFAVTGTPNRLEYDQGFFVKNGDGSADLKPIAHLYKTQVYQLAEHLGIPAEIRAQVPTTDTYPMAQTQEEFYFALPYDRMDLCLYALNNGIPAAAVASAAGLSDEQVRLVFRDIEAKRRATAYLHMKPALVEPVELPHIQPPRERSSAVESIGRHGGQDGKV